MNLMNYISVFFLILVSLTGAIYDWKIRKIPNWLTFGTFFLVLLINICNFNFNWVLNSILGFLLGIALLIIPYLMGAMGAGDVKLLGAVGAITGFKSVIFIFFSSTICGLFLALIWIACKPGHLKFLITTAQVLPVVDKWQKFPYGVAIFLGTILYIISVNMNLFDLNLHLVIWQ